MPDHATLKAELLIRYYNDPLAGYFSTEKIVELLLRYFSQLGLAKDINEYVRTCNIYQRVRAPYYRLYSEIQALPYPNSLQQELLQDFITGLPPSKKNACVYDAILVIVNRYTKIALYIAYSIIVIAPKLAELFIEYIIRRFGTLKSIVSDRGSLFTSKFQSEVYFYTYIKRRLSTAFYPQTNG